MNKEIEDLTKAIDLGQLAVDVLLKSHVKAYTRTTASGASVQVKEHNDKRQAAEEASKHADKSKFDSNDPEDIRAHAANHIGAAFAHIEALKHATTNKDINHHFEQASRHLMANDGLHSVANGLDHGPIKNRATQHADNSEKHAWDIGKHANGTKVDESTSEGLNKKSSLHLLAAQQHQLAGSNHMVAAGRNYDDEEVSGYHEDHAQDHRAAAREHGAEVQRLSQIATRAIDKAYKASNKAKKSNTPEDHKEAANAHREAAKLDWGSSHEAKAAEHEKKAKALEEATKVHREYPHPWNAYGKNLAKEAAKRARPYEEGSEAWHVNADMKTAAKHMLEGNHEGLKQALEEAHDNYTREQILNHIHPDHWKGLGIDALDKKESIRKFEATHGTRRRIT